MRQKFLMLIPALLLSACSGASEPNSKDKALLQMADNLQKTGNYEETIGIYARLADEEKSDVTYHIQLAKLQRKLGRAPDAVVVMRDAQRIKPEDARVLSQLGYSLIAAGQTKEASEVFDQWVKLEPKNAMAYNGQAIALDHTGDHAGAQEVYRKALALVPTNAADIQNNMAMSMILAGQYKDAIGQLEPLVKNGGTQVTRQNLALAYGLSGDKKRALELNLKDLPADKAKENLRFYDAYLKRAKKSKKPITSIRVPNQPVDESMQEAAPVGAVDSSDGEKPDASSDHPSWKTK